MMSCSTDPAASSSLPDNPLPRDAGRPSRGRSLEGRLKFDEGCLADVNQSPARSIEIEDYVQDPCEDEVRRQPQARMTLTTCGRRPRRGGSGRTCTTA